jgi:hypothetical protein
MSLLATDGQVKLFHAPTNVKMASARMLDFTSGKTIWKNTRMLLQPSMRAASKMSCGIPKIAWRMINTPKAVGNGMISALIPYYLEGNTIHAKNIVADVYRAIRRNDLDEALQVLKVYLASVPYAEHATSEGHYQTMLYVVFSLLGRYVQMEVRTAKGRIDMVLETKTDLYVMELKIDRPAREALEQIDRNGYLLPYSREGLRLHKVGIAFSTEDRTLSGWEIADAD